MDNLYRITFSGQLSPGAHPELVRTLIANRMKLTASQVDRMFCGKKVILKNSLVEEEAVAFAARLSRLGMLVDILPMPPEESDSMAAEASPPAADARADTSAVASPAPGEIAAAAQAAAAGDAPASPPEAVPAAPGADLAESPATASPGPESPLAISTELPTSQITQLAPRPESATSSQFGNPRFDESWLTQSSFANLARTHLNLDRAEALLNVASPVMPQHVDLHLGPQTLAPNEGTPVVQVLAKENMAEPIAAPHQPIHITTEFSCTHCGTLHRIELNITQMEAPAQIRTRQERASA